MTNITDKWEKASFAEKVGFVELRKEQREQFPDSEYERFKMAERSMRDRIKKHTAKILALRAS